MTNAIARKTIAAVAIGAGLFTAFGGDAHAQTREHILLARQVGVVAQPSGGTQGNDADCWDWTNEDGTHGTNCPSTGGGGGGGDRGWIQIESFGWS